MKQNNETKWQAPEALRLADKLNSLCVAEFAWPTLNEAAIRLRRLHAENERLSAQVEAFSAAQEELAAMRAGGEPVARIKRLESRGACLEWYADWSDLMVGDHLYIRPQPAAQDAVAVGEPVANSRPSLEAVFRSLSDRAYCNYIEQMRRDVCLGWEYKAAHGKFGELELKGHVLAAQQLGRHKAFMEAANALRGSDAPLTHPQPAAQDAELLDWLGNQYVTVRIPLPYGSRECFIGAPDDNDGAAPSPWDIRAAIRTAIAAKGDSHE